MKRMKFNVVAMVLLAVFMVSAASFSEAGMDLVSITDMDPSIRLDIRYATTNNFTGKAVYPCAKCLLRKEVAVKLVQVSHKLHERGLGLKVYDCYRPTSVQKIFWSIMPDERYVANPAKGSRHNRGTAVDVGLTDSKGKELPLPSEYDDFSERAHRGYSRTPAEQRKNSDILEATMKEAGFIPFPTEWWHFDYTGWENYPYVDSTMCGNPQ